MIKRNIPKNIIPSERLQEYSFTASHSINVTTAPTIRDTIYDSTNMQVNLDGSLSIRKPLQFKQKWVTDYMGNTYKTIYSGYLFDGVTYLHIQKHLYSNSIRINCGKSYSEAYMNSLDIYTTSETNIIASSNSIPAICKDIKITNTVNSTILSGILFNLVEFAGGSFNTADDAISENYQYRYLKIVKDSETDVFKIIFIEPEMPTINASDTISINYNTTADYVYSLTDNYSAQAVSVAAILPYVSKNQVTTISRGLKVKNILKSEDFITFSALRDPKAWIPLILKAFINVKEDSGNYYCTWEKSYDGVIWQEVPEFTKYFSTVDVAIVDNTNSYQGLEDTFVNTRIVKYTMLNAHSEEDMLYSRPDVLILQDANDSATYRFSIVSLYKASDEIFTRHSITKENALISSKNEKVSAKLSIYYKINPYETYDEENISFETHLVKLSENRAEGISELSEENIKTTKEFLVDASSGKLLKIDVEFPNLSLETGFAAQSINAAFCLKYFGKLVDEFKDFVIVSYNNTFVKSNVITNSDSYFITVTGENGWDFTYKTNNERSYFDVNLYRAMPLDYITLKNFIKTVPSVPTLIDMPEYINFSFAKEFKEAVLDTLINVGCPYTESAEGLSAGVPINFKYCGLTVQAYAENTLFTKADANIVLDLMGYDPDCGNDVLRTSKLIAWKNVENDCDFVRIPNEYSEEWLQYFLDIKNTTVHKSNPYLGYVSGIKFDGISQTLRKGDGTYLEFTPTAEESANKPSLQLGYALWNVIKTNFTELLNTKIPNTVSGNKLYHNHRIFTYGKEFKNCIYVSDVDSFTTPLFNMIDLSATEDSVVTALVPWRDYLIAATENSIHLIKETADGFTSKAINTYIGISEKDSKTCKAILNGLVFKSGTKIYSLQPSVYSSDDSILNISEISKPIANYIEDGELSNFSIVTEQAYYLFIPGDTTLCLCYEFTRKIWTKYVYPVKLINYQIHTVENITVFDDNLNEYYFEKQLNPDVFEYGDILDNSGNITKIPFKFDSGQKADDISKTKQFVESKLILATLNDKDTFPINVDILIDGVEFKQLHFDSSSSGAIWKTNANDILTLGTAIDSDSRNLFNSLRQMLVRYSGKGKSIRHIVSGISNFNFKFYVLYYRYKNTHVKQ